MIEIKLVSVISFLLINNYKSNYKSQSMENTTQQQYQEEPIFGTAFNLHPLDALNFLQNTHDHLKEFTYAFKQRIQTEIEYSKALIKVSKILSKHVNPTKASPISYISSAFKVQHELRARHALQLAEYLHTQIEIPCDSLLHETQFKLKQMNEDLKRQYKEGQAVQQTYQKYLKKYYRSRQDWQQRMIMKTILPYIPGSSQSQIQKANAKLLQQKQENAQITNKYLSSLQNFNKFAQKFNENISSLILVIDKQSKKQMSLESNCLRKLIVSEINMFKNIEYDMINISKQMEMIKPDDQLQMYLQEQGSIFAHPIISIYSDGPIVQINQQNIDFKYPITRSFLQETLLRIERQNFTWMMENKHNSTLKHAILQVWKKFQGLQSEDFMQDLQECVNNNKVVKQISVKIQQKQVYLNSDQAFSVSFSIISNLASFIRPLQLSQNKEIQTIQLLRSYLNLHHFYRFFAVTSLQEFLNLRQNILYSKIQGDRLVMIVKLLLEECLKAKDVFVLRSILTIMFSTELGQNRIPFYTQATLIDFDIWSSNDFWESLIFEATFQQIKLLPCVTKSQLKQVYLMRQKNIVFSTLATYCHYMVMVGCQLKQVKEIAGRYCHIYSLYDEHEKDLSKMIKASADKLTKLTQQLALYAFQNSPFDIEKNPQQPQNELADKPKLDVKQHSTDEPLQNQKSSESTENNKQTIE